MPDNFVQRAVEDRYRRKLELIVPTGTTLQIFLWPGMPDGNQMHPRFVLTERGGVNFDHGLDEGRSPTLVTLLEHEVFKSKWQDFSETGAPFGTPTRFEVEGQG